MQFYRVDVDFIENNLLIILILQKFVLLIYIITLVDCFFDISPHLGDLSLVFLVLKLNAQ